MARAMRKVAEYLGLVDGGEYTDEFGEDATFQGYEDQDAVRPSASASGYERAVSQNENSYIAPARPAAPLSDVYRITTLHPHTYNDARRIGEEFRVGTPVIMNLSDMEESERKRLVDFASGLVFGHHGSIERVTPKVFLLTPPNVSVSVEDKNSAAQASFFNQS